MIEKYPKGKKRDHFCSVTYPTYIVRVEKINALMINSRRWQIMVTIPKHFGDVFTSPRRPGQSTYPKIGGGRGGSLGVVVFCLSLGVLFLSKKGLGVQGLRFRGLGVQGFRG